MYIRNTFSTMEKRSNLIELIYAINLEKLIKNRKKGKEYRL